MKKMYEMAAILCLLVSKFTVLAQTVRPELTVLNKDTKGAQLEPSQMGNLVRIEI